MRTRLIQSVKETNDLALLRFPKKREKLRAFAIALLNPEMKAPTAKASVMKAVIKPSMTESMAKALVMKARMETVVMSAMETLQKASRLEASEVPCVESSVTVKSTMKTEGARGLVTLYKAMSAMVCMPAMAKTRGESLCASPAQSHDQGNRSGFKKFTFHGGFPPIQTP